jgi:hypothetical protein
MHNCIDADLWALPTRTHMSASAQQLQRIPILQNPGCSIDNVECASWRRGGAPRDHAYGGRPAGRRRRCREPRLDRDLGLCVHRCRNQLAVHHTSSLKNIESKLTLSEEEIIHVMLYRNPPKMMEGPRSFMMNSHLMVDMVCCRSATLNAVRIKSST